MSMSVLDTKCYTSVATAFMPFMSVSITQICDYCLFINNRIHLSHTLYVQFTGRVERVGWGQTRIRGTDTRPTYVPNAQFAQAAVTNNERITHRKFETIVPLRFQVTKSTHM